MQTARSRLLLAVVVVLTGAAAVAACSSSSNPPATGATCGKAGDCYPGVDATKIKGTVTCLTQLQNGYCTHTCTASTDCCAASGECPAGFSAVCAPLQSAPQTYCFVSCDSAAISAAPNGGTTDPNAFCQKFANPTFTCRATGGGNPQKFCGP
jgi:hypothetical protein